MQNPRTKESRKARRVSLSCRLFFFGENDFEGEAKVLDISFSGCCATSEIEVVVGMRLKLSIFLPDGHPWPLRVDDAVVRWIQDKNFGLEFLSIRPAQLSRVQAFVMKKR